MNDHSAETPIATQMPIYHYTVGTSLASILASGNISTEEDFYFSWMAPAVRCTTRPDWEPTAGVYHVDRRGRTLWRTKDETEARCGGLIRIRVKPDSAPFLWSDFVTCTNTCMCDEDAASFAEAAACFTEDARNAGSDYAEWFVSLGPIQRCNWLSVDVWHEGAWVSIKVTA